MSDQSEGLPTLDRTRQVTIDALCEHFANDVIGVDEFERRIDVAHNATSPDALKELLRDLPGGQLPAVRRESVPTDRPATVAVATKERELAVAIMGGSSRKGAWTPAKTNYAVAVMGGVELDFREAVMPVGVTELQVYAMWGGVEIIVPPHIQVESHGLAIMGGFDHASDLAHPPDPSAPTLRISGLALMGGVDIKVRLRGETARDARQRRRLERRRQRHLRRGGLGPDED